MTRPRTLEPGTQIGRYRVVSLLGTGGMGEVYLARDETLDRSVALKILPPDLVKNEERVRRFVQEAKSASSLNHPHIVTIYEIGPSTRDAVARSGQAPATSSGQGDDIHYIAMELVSGHTLKTLIHQDKTDLKTLVRYIAQAADGLAKAHAAGIVHRDLKPENIMVTSDGFAKVVDFGLAKLAETAGAADAANTRTALGGETGAGMILGTVGYMSPEQVQGKTVDHRSDIFSLGCVLYEAATRQRPFQADSDVETLARILKERPQPIEEINPEVPGELRRIIRRCLAKSPDQRAHSMKDLALELAEIADEYDTLSASSGSGTRVSSGVMGEAPASSTRRVAIAAAAVIGALALAAAVWSIASRNASSGGEAPTQGLDIRRVMSDPSLLEIALSPDGQQLAFTRSGPAGTTIWIRQLVTGSELQIAASERQLTELSFSSDGAYVYFAALSGREREVFRVPSLGGQPQLVAGGIVNAWAVSHDGRQIAFARRASEPGSPWVVVLADLDQRTERVLSNILPGSLAWSPDGTTIALDHSTSSADGMRSLSFISVDSGDTETITIEEMALVFGPTWIDSNELAVYGSAAGSEPGEPRQIWRISYPDGHARRITTDANGFQGLTGSSDGLTLAGTQSRYSHSLSSTPASNLDAGTRLHSSEDALRLDASAAAGPSSVFFTEARSLWSIRPDGSSLRRISPEGFSWAHAGTVSRADDALFFDGSPDGNVEHVFRTTIEGRDLRQVTSGDGEEIVSLSPDGQAIIFRRRGAAALWALPIAGGDPEPWDDPPAIAYSPDGRFGLATLGLLGPARGYLVWSVADGTEVRSWEDPLASPLRTRWAPDGNAIDIVRDTDGIGNLWRLPLDGSEPRQLTHFTAPGLFSFAWSQDGTTLYYTRREVVSQDVVLITNFR